MLQLQQILLPTDFSEPSLTATKYAVEFAHRFGAKLHLLHVIEDPVIYMPMFESFPLPSREDFETFAQTRLESWILPEDRQGIEVVYRWVHGQPFVEIIKDAAANNIDMMVIGTHGRGRTLHLMMGNVAERVVRKAPCPVLTVRPEGHQFVHPLSESAEE